MVEHFREIDEQHRDWLRGFGPQQLHNWEQLRQANPEAATVEACTKSFLFSHVEKIEPSDIPGTGGADFVCYQNGSKFYVEATCMEQSAVEIMTGLTTAVGTEGGEYSLIDFFNKCMSKADQASRCKDASCLLAIGTLHPLASEMCFDDFAAEDILSPPLNCSRTGVVVAKNVRMPYAPFFESDGITPARRSISGLLLFGFGCMPPRVHGVLHPDAVRPFSRNLLPRISFSRLTQEYKNGVFKVETI